MATPVKGVESVGFLNDMLAQLWEYINTAGADLLKEIVEPMFKDLLPGPLKSLHFTKIDFGKVPIQFDNIDVHKRSEGVIKLDVDVDWQGDCDIELKAGIIGVGAEKVHLKGRMSVLLCPLVHRIPLFTAVQVAFINPPEMDLDFTGAADIADFSAIDNTIRKVIQDVLAMLLVLPNRLFVKIDPSNDYFKTVVQPLGTLRLTCVSGRGFKTPKGFFKDIPDMYCKIHMGALGPWQTTTKDNDVTPEWNESKDFLLSDHEQEITIEVLDDDLVGDDQIGVGKISVAELFSKGKTADVKLYTTDKKTKAQTDTGATISIKADLFNFVTDVTSFELPENKKQNLTVGLATITVAGACDIPGDRKKLSPNVKVHFGGSDFMTPTVVDMPGMDPINPAFDVAFRVPLTSEITVAPSDFILTLFDSKSKLGTVTIPYGNVISAPGLCLSTAENCDLFKLDNGITLQASISVHGMQLSTN